MALAEAIGRALAARRMRTKDVAARFAAAGNDRATLYRLLSGQTTQPRLGTLLLLCEVLDLSPTELLQLADRWPYRERAGDAADRSLRAHFAPLQALPPPEKERAVLVVEALADAWARIAAAASAVAGEEREAGR